MNPSYTTNLMSSFYLWLDHELASVGQGFINTSGQLYPIYDPSCDGYNVYSSPFRQWISDSSIPQAVVPSGVYCDGALLNRDSGVIFNFNKGQVLLPNNIKPSLVTTQYSKKDFNIYYTDEREENLLFENAHPLQSKFRNITGGLGGDDQPFPCVFIKNTSYQNIPYSFGGQEQTKTTIRCIILSDNMYLLDGAISVMTDTVRKVFPLIQPSNLPYNYYGDFKSGTQYQYPQIASAASVQTTNLIYIDRVTVSRLDEIRNKHINLKVVAAMVDFDLWQARYPRIYNNGNNTPVIPPTPSGVGPYYLSTAYEPALNSGEITMIDFNISSGITDPNMLTGTYNSIFINNFDASGNDNTSYLNGLTGSNADIYLTQGDETVVYRSFTGSFYNGEMEIYYAPIINNDSGYMVLLASGQHDFNTTDPITVGYALI